PAEDEQNACNGVSALMDDAPTTWPLLFTPPPSPSNGEPRIVRKLFVPPSVPRSTIPPPDVQENAWVAALPLVADWPTTWPLPVTALASLNVPPSVPRSTIPPPEVQENAWLAVSPAVEDSPTTWPLPLTAMASLFVPPRVPRSVGPAKTLGDDAPTSTGSESTAKVPNSKPAKQA